ncbi:MAG: hypothetical protein ACYCOU_07995 [Sulfobacillus sp.]
MKIKSRYSGMEFWFDRQVRSTVGGNDKNATNVFETDGLFVLTQVLPQAVQKLLDLPELPMVMFNCGTWQRSRHFHVKCHVDPERYAEFTGLTDFLEVFRERYSHIRRTWNFGNLKSSAFPEGDRHRQFAGTVLQIKRPFASFRSISASSVSAVFSFDGASPEDLPRICLWVFRELSPFDRGFAVGVIRDRIFIKISAAVYGQFIERVSKKPPPEFAAGLLQKDGSPRNIPSIGKQHFATEWPLLDARITAKVHEVSRRLATSRAT